MKMISKLYSLPRRLLKKDLLRQTIKLSAISMLANFLGFLIPSLIAWQFGISKDTDNFFFSYGIITFASTIFTAALRSSLVPFLTEKLAVNKDSFDGFVSSLFYYSFYVVSIVSGILLALFLSLNHFMTGNFFFYLALSVPILFFTVQNAICYGILNSMKQYYVAETSPFSRALVIYACIFFLGRVFGITAVIVGYNLGELAKFIHLMYIIRKKNNIRLSRSLVDYTSIKPFLKEGSYQAISTTIISASPVIDKIVASFLIVGSLSILDYGNRLFMIFNVLFSSFLTIILSKWSEDVVKKRFSMKKMNQTVLGVFCMTSCVFLLVLLFRSQVVYILYPKIQARDRELIAIVLVLNMAGFIFNSSNQVINRATLAFKSTSILIRISVIKSIINIVMDVVLALRFGVIGIAVSTIIVHMSG
ncbi:MAG: hypothetical protein JST39_17190, partial [Bacteroidetes bacterium]|nr:hypothetical protein [Bacteroidota bacterium]